MKLLQLLGGLFAQRSYFAGNLRVTFGERLHGIFARENKPVVLVDVFFELKGKWRNLNDRHGKYLGTFVREHGNQLVLLFFRIGANEGSAF